MVSRNGVRNGSTRRSRASATSRNQSTVCEDGSKRSAISCVSAVPLFVGRAADNVGCEPTQIPLSKPLKTNRLQRVRTGTRFELLDSPTRGSRELVGGSARPLREQGCARGGRAS